MPSTNARNDSNRRGELCNKPRKIHIQYSPSKAWWKTSTHPFAVSMTICTQQTSHLATTLQQLKSKKIPLSTTDALWPLGCVGGVVGRRISVSTAHALQGICTELAHYLMQSSHFISQAIVSLKSDMFNRRLPEHLSPVGLLDYLNKCNYSEEQC